MKKILLASVIGLTLAASAVSASPASSAMASVELFDAGTDWSIGAGLGLGGEFDGAEAIGLGVARHFDGYTVYIKAGTPLEGASIKDTSVFLGTALNF